MAWSENVLKSLISGLGVKPEEIIGALQFLLDEAKQIKADRESYKAGVAQFLPTVVAHMQRTDTSLEQLRALMLDIQSRLPPRALEGPIRTGESPPGADTIEAPQLMNGAAHHE